MIAWSKSEQQPSKGKYRPTIMLFNWVLKFADTNISQIGE